MDNDQEEYEGESDDEQADNADESEGDEFEQETGWMLASHHVMPMYSTPFWQLFELKNN